MEKVDTLTNPSPGKHSRWFDYFRLAVAAILLLPAIWFSWKTVDGLETRRVMRTDLAEIENAQYGILSADKWRAIIGPILNAQIDQLDFKGQSKSLRPMVQHALNTLLDNIAASKPSGIQGMFVGKMIDSLRPQVPQYTDVVMGQLVNSGTQKSFKDSIRGVLANAVANTFGNTDMTAYNAILRRYGCSSGAVCEQTLGQKIAAADTQLDRCYLTVLASAALGFILLMVGTRMLSRGAIVVLMLFCLAMLVGGVLSPMLEVEVRVNKIDATLLGTPIEFQNQSLYYRSKTVLEVFQTLIHMGRPEMTLVGVLVIAFSVVFPDAEAAGARGQSLPAGAVAHQPHRQDPGFRAIQMVHGRRHGARDLHVLCRLQQRRRQRARRPAHHARGATGHVPDGCVKDPAWLLLVHRFLHLEHHPVEKAGARDCLQFRFRIKLARTSMLRARR